MPRESIGIIDENYEFAGINEKKYPEWRDLFAIDTMLANGIPWKPRPQASGRGMDGVTSPDGESLGFMVEIKSPRNGTKSPKPGNELEFVFDCLKKAKHNFSNPYDYVERIAAGHAVKPVKVVLSTRYRTGSWNTSDFESKLRREMMAIGIDEVLWIDTGGRIRRYI